MDNVYEGKVMWSHLDANMHMRHSAYADFAAQARIAVLDSLGLDFKVFQNLKVGPILFREELIYLREIGVNDIIKVTLEMTKSKPDGSRWSIRHEIYRGDGVKAAVVNVDGAWIDIVKRKLTVLPEDLAQKFSHLPKSDDFEDITD
ncbi:acyl-CoA thioesterase [Pontibacter silvestris]|uniref:Acyl-CoA thioesterase n=1 Tax=Pontibacter silvestris TaxID=2305183 RepID=A0ABW4WU66_9BACT|nr:acyl-CoA thioesterase [Pontibacter silvestris]MCC9137714.1 thioesterase family protein [Pontibacter silvestris]